ncbi:MAG: Mu transposase C-terminal domain-containing protein [Crocosphaera sp.]
MSPSVSIPDDNPHSHRLPSDEMINDEVKAKMDIIQSLIEPCDRITYRQRKEQAAKKLGVTIRSVERLLKKYREQGLIALVNTRSDKGKTRIDSEWKEFILNTYKEGNKGSKRITRHQVFLKVKGRAKQLGLKTEEFPSHQTVYRILDKFIEENERKKKARSPGYSGSRLTHITRDGRELEVEGSNDVWQCDHTRLDIRLVDEFGVLSRPWLTIIIDSYSRCVMGFFLGFYAPSSHVDALALRHAILPKSYSSDYQLKTGSNVQERPKNVDKDACLTLKDLEKILVKYIVDEHNQKPDARMKNQSRIARWGAGLPTEPYLYDERELDIALMKEAKRTLQKSGTLQFENLTYRSSLLRGREGERVSIRYDPDDITTILVYEYLDDGTEAFLDYAHAQNLETEKLSYRELKAINKKLNQEEEAINNDKVLDAMMERMEMTEKLVKKNRQQRQQNAHEKVNSPPSVTEKLSIPEPDEDNSNEELEDQP